MNIFSFSVKRPVTVTVILAALVIIGVMFGSRINIDDFPDIDIPVISVTTQYPGAGPEEIEEQITILVEEAVGSVSNIDEIESTSQDSLSVVIVRFKYGTNMDTSAADIREKLDKIKNDLPTQAKSPVITKADPSDSPIIRLTLTGPSGNMRRIRSIARNDVKKELEKIGGIASVDISGGIERAIEVKVNRDKLETHNVTIGQVAQAISSENRNIPAGRLSTDNLEFSIRTMGELEDVKDFSDVLVSVVNGRPIYLKDVATVIDGKKEVRTKTRNNGEPCVTVEIKKNTDANTVNVADNIKKAVKKLKKSLPEGFNILVAYDDSRFIKEAIQNLQETAIQGSVLAIIMVLIFLGSFRSTLVIGLSIPSCIIAAFLLMYFSGMTLNMITLLGFILAVGNIVDASIVVLENIYRHMEMGKDIKTAAIEGTKEVGHAVLGAAGTTAVVFVPILIMSGLSGQIFRPLAKTFIFVIMSSLVMAVFMVPMLCSKFLVGEVQRKDNPKTLMYKFNRAFDRFFGWLLSVYKGVLNWCLNHRLLVVVFALIIFVGGMFMWRFMKMELQGKWDRGDFIVSIEAPVGSSLERTEKIVNVVEDFILKNTPEKHSIISDIGQGPSGVRRGAGGAQGAAPRLGGITVSLKPADVRDRLGQRSMYEVQDMITERFKDYPGAKIQVESLFNISGKKPIEILIRGNDIETLAGIAENIRSKMEKVEGLKNLDLSYRPGAPEFRIKVDRKKAADVGVGAGEVGNFLRTLISEDEISTFREAGNEYDIFVQLPEEQRNSILKLKTLKLMTRSGKRVPLSEIADVTPAYGPSSITRRDRARYVSVQADTTGRALSEVLQEVKPILQNQKFPTGYNYVIAGEEQRRQEIFAAMFQSLFLAIILVYVFLAVQFESFIHPFTIMVSVPLVLVGLVGALLITGSTMTMFTLLGLIMLVGIVVSAAIVLIDYIIQRKESGLKTFDAIKEAAPLRLRPIIMTVGTTILAMVPLALGLKAGTELFQPLAIGSIGGLLTSSVLTLLVIPTVYSIFEDLIEKFFKKNSKNKSEMEKTV